MAKSQTSSKKELKSVILTAYMDAVLEHEVHPKSVYKFCKSAKIDEAAFYEHFNSMYALAAAVWSTFHENTLTTLEKSKEIAGFSNREKVLMYLFTFFENLTLNRSYVAFVLSEVHSNWKELKMLKALRTDYKGFIEGLIADENELNSSGIFKYNKQFFAEAAWAQFLVLLKFYLNDDSKGFEKTDVFIEKSVNTVFDVFDNTPLESALDLGKFLFKESFSL